jgi:hypothetical protein
MSIDNENNNTLTSTFYGFHYFHNCEEREIKYKEKILEKTRNKVGTYNTYCGKGQGQSGLSLWYSRFQWGLNCDFGKTRSAAKRFNTRLPTCPSLLAGTWNPPGQISHICAEMKEKYINQTNTPK